MRLNHLVIYKTSCLRDYVLVYLQGIHMRRRSIHLEQVDDACRPKVGPLASLWLQCTPIYHNECLSPETFAHWLSYTPTYKKLGSDMSMLIDGREIIKYVRAIFQKNKLITFHSCTPERYGWYFLELKSQTQGIHINTSTLRLRGHSIHRVTIIYKVFHYSDVMLI